MDDALAMLLITIILACNFCGHSRSGQRMHMLSLIMQLHRCLAFFVKGSS